MSPFCKRWTFLFLTINISILIVAGFYKNYRNKQCRILRSKPTKKHFINDKMEKRLEHVQNICSRMEIVTKKGICDYQSHVPQFNQKVSDSFIRDPNTGTIYCFIHKVWDFTIFLFCSIASHLQVASSTWMSLYTSFEHKTSIREEILESHQYYKVITRREWLHFEILLRLQEGWGLTCGVCWTQRTSNSW